MASNSVTAHGSRITPSDLLASEPRLCNVHRVVAETPSRVLPSIAVIRSMVKT
jgi:hypothetical protein